MAVFPKSLPEFNIRPYTGVKFHSLIANVIATCGCGNPEPLTIPYMQGLDFWVTCGTCKRRYGIISVTWNRGMEHPEVRISMKEPEILPAPQISVPQS